MLVSPKNRVIIVSRRKVMRLNIMRKRRDLRGQKYGGRHKKSNKFPGLSLIRGKFFQFLVEHSKVVDGERQAQVSLSQIQWRFGVGQASIYSWMRGLVENEYIRVDKTRIGGIRHNVYVLLK